MDNTESVEAGALVPGASRPECPCTMDAHVWADKFCERFPEMDKGLMIGWFANAIMAGYGVASFGFNKS